MEVTYVLEDTNIDTIRLTLCGKFLRFSNHARKNDGTFAHSNLIVHHYIRGLVFIRLILEIVQVTVTLWAEREREKDDQFDSYHGEFNERYLMIISGSHLFCIESYDVFETERHFKSQVIF